MPDPLHPRRLIQDRIVELLTGHTAAGSRVTKTRVDPNRVVDLPAISVYILSETVDDASADTHPRELTRYPVIEIAAWAEGTEAVPVDDALNALSLQIETEMAKDRFLAGTVGDKGAILKTTEITVLGGGEGDPLIGVLKLTYAATYYTLEIDAAPTEDFERAHVTTQIAGAALDIAVHDQFEIPTT